MARATPGGSPSRCGAGPSCRRLRAFRCRSRAASRDAASVAPYRSRARLARSFSRHASQQVFWCPFADGFGWNLRPHSLQRRRSSFRRFAPIPRRSPETPRSAPIQPRRPAPSSGSRAAREVDLTQAAAKAPPSGDSGALLSGYEEIRSQALRSGCSGRGHGLALFVRRGMAAWLTACAPLTRPPEALREKPAESDRVPPDLRNEVATVLAEMALTAIHTQGASTC